MNPICDFKNGLILYRGKDVRRLIGERTFVETLVLLLTGEYVGASDPRCQMIEALLIAWADHGEPPPSTRAVRSAASVGAPFVQAAICGFSMFGWDHAPVDGAADLLATCMAVGMDHARDILRAGGKLSGFGHPVHSSDPRTERLLDVAKRCELHREHCALLDKIEHLLASDRKSVSANVAGVTAALWLDMGFNRESVGVIGLAGRAVGMAAHHSEVTRSGEKFIGTP